MYIWHNALYNLTPGQGLGVISVWQTPRQLVMEGMPRKYKELCQIKKDEKNKFRGKMLLCTNIG